MMVDFNSLNNVNGKFETNVNNGNLNFINKKVNIIKSTTSL